MALLDFADLHLRGRSVNRRFDAFPEEINPGLISSAGERKLIRD
jgi:hypothetical protein